MSQHKASLPHRFASHSLDAIAAILLALVVLVPLDVAASNWGVTNPAAECTATVASQCNSRTGTGRVYFFAIVDPDGFIVSGTKFAMANEYEPVPDISLTTTTDYAASTVRIYTADVDNGYWAWTLCPSYATKGKAGTRYAWCEPQVLYYNNGPTYGFETRYDSATEVRSLACHELGHSFGLRHSTSSSNGGPNWDLSCMRPSQTVNARNTSNHDEPALTALYPLP